MNDPLLEPFVPDWVSPPGATIADLIVEKIETSESPVNELVALPDLLGLSDEGYRQLLLGETPITEQLARRLELVIGGPADFWLRREAQYREFLTRRVNAAAVAERIKNAAASFVPTVFDTAATAIAQSELVLMATEFLRMKSELAEMQQAAKPTVVQLFQKLMGEGFGERLLESLANKEQR